MKTAEDIVKNRKLGSLISITADATLHEASQLMVCNKVGAILVLDNGQVAGIWTERDLLKNIVKEGFDLKTAVINDYMTTGLESAPYTDTVYQLMDRFLGLRLRHLLVEKEGEYIGLISIGDVIKECVREKDQELRNLNAIVSWDYYEDWRWHDESK